MSRLRHAAPDNPKSRSPKDGYARCAPALGLKVSNRLLDLLSTDDDFRELFVKDAKAALEFAGYVHADERLPHPAACLFSRTGDLASKEQITASREKLTATVNSIQGMMSPFVSV